MKTNWKIIIGACLAIPMLMLSSCERDFTTTELEGLEYGLAVPLGSASLSLSDLIDDDMENVVVNADSSLQIVYRNDSILGYTVADLLELPEQNPSVETFKLGVIAIDDFGPLDADILLDEMLNQVDTALADSIRALEGFNVPLPALISNSGQEFEFSDFDDFEWVRFSEGRLILTVSNQLPLTINSAQLSVETIDPSQTIIPLGSFNYAGLAPSETISDTIQLANVTLYNAFKAQLSAFETAPSNGAVTVDLQTGITLTLVGENLKVVAGKARLPEQSIDLIEEVIDFGVEKDERLVELALQEARLEYEFSSTFSVDFLVEVDLPSTTIAGDPVHIEINANSSQSDVIDLSNCMIDLSSNAQNPYNQIPVNIALTMGAQNQWIEFDSSSVVSFTYHLIDLEFDYARGWLGKQEAALGADTVTVADEFLDKISGTILFENPEISLLVNNNMGIPVSFEMDIQNILRDGSIVDLDADVLTIPYPLVIGESIVNTPVSINNQNANLSEFLSQIPAQIFFSGNTYLNYETPANEYVYTNFITHEGEVKLGLEIDLPLALSISNLQFVDTLETTLDAETLEDVEYIELSVVTENGIPFEMDCVLELYNDIQQARLDSIEIDLLDPAAVDNSGKVIEPNRKVTKFVLDKNRIDNLAQTNFIRILAKVNTANDGADISQFYSDYTFDIQLGLLVRYYAEID